MEQWQLDIGFDFVVDGVQDVEHLRRSGYGVVVG